MTRNQFKWRGSIAAAMLMALVCAPSVRAQGTEASASPVTPQVEWTRGTVVQADAVRGWVTLKHEAIKSIDMDAMTMPFKVKQPAVLAGLKRGDAVRFEVGVEGNDLLIMRIEKRKKGN